jgi:uncharacterized circularly permuted ATP-grasp superfamily protein
MRRIPEARASYRYVRSVDGDYAVQVRHDTGYFVILTDDLAFPGGIGWATEWEVVPAREVPRKLRRELRWAIDGYVDYLASRGQLS